MGKEEFLRDLGVMLNDDVGKPNRGDDNSDLGSEPVNRANAGIDLSKQLSSLGKELKVLKQQMESMKSEMREVINLQKKSPTVPAHGHAELEESIKELLTYRKRFQIFLGAPASIRL
jgi:hypothetical protein